MDNELKFYLLAEKSGWNCSTYAFDYRRKLSSLSSYQILSYNVIEAKRHLSGKAKEVVKEYESIKLEPRTLEECFIIETKLNYLCLHSFPEYYINPLSVNPNYKGEINSIGDLIINIQGQDMSINEMIESDRFTPDMKKESVKDAIDDYASDMNVLVSNSIEAIQEGTRKRTKKFRALTQYMEILLFIIMNFFLFFTVLYPQNNYWECFYNPRPNYVLTYVSYVLPISILAYDFFFSIYHSINARIEESYHYAKRFLKYHSEKIYDDILYESEKLYDYLSGAINRHITLKNDILDFSRLSNSYIDFEELSKVDSAKKKKGYKAIRTLNYIFTTIAFLVSFFSFFFYLYSCILNTAI